MNKKKVMIADDSGFMRQNLKMILVNAGYEVIGEACDGLDAVEKFEQLKPDLVTMDITMPKMDGIQALKIIKQLNNAVKVVVCSSMGQSYHIEEAMSHGADDFIVKPFTPHTVKAIVQKLLSA